MDEKLIPSFTKQYAGRSNKLSADLLVFGANGDARSGKMFKSLWDTGATGSAITKNVADALGLQPVSKVKIYTPSGFSIRNVYYASFLLPNNITIAKLLVADVLLNDCDVLIGMDIIGRGDFAVSNLDGKTSFSFRIPSCERLDFTLRRKT